MALSVFSYLERQDLSNCHSVCHRFNECLNRDSFWKSWFYCRNDKNIIEERDLNYLKVNWKWISRCRLIEPAHSAVLFFKFLFNLIFRHSLEWPLSEVVLANFTMESHMVSVSLYSTMPNT
jgi:hypothetical protein